MSSVPEERLDWFARFKRWLFVPDEHGMLGWIWVLGGVLTAFIIGVIEVLFFSSQDQMHHSGTDHEEFI